VNVSASSILVVIDSCFTVASKDVDATVNPMVQFSDPFTYYHTI